MTFFSPDLAFQMPDMTKRVGEWSYVQSPYGNITFSNGGIEDQEIQVIFGFRKDSVSILIMHCCVSKAAVSNAFANDNNEKGRAWLAKTANDFLDELMPLKQRRPVIIPPKAPAKPRRPTFTPPTE
jgi:hypothetical protein